MKQYKFKINGKNYEVSVNSVEGNIADVTVNGNSYKVEMENAPVQPVSGQNNTTVAAQPAAPAAAVTAAPEASAKPAAKPAAGNTVITSPLPGVIVEVSVKVGDVVSEGQQVAVLEAMKMENAIEATKGGTVVSVEVNKGDSVLEGAPVVTIA